MFLLGLGPSTVLGQFRDGNENSQTVVTAQGALGWGLDLLSLYSDFLSEPFPPAMSVFSICKICTIWGHSAWPGMLSQPLLCLASTVSCRRTKLLLCIALLTFVASVWDNLVNMRPIQENGELRIESRLDKIIEPLREKIRDLEKSFTQKYSPVKFLLEKDCKRILVTGGMGFVGSHLMDKLMMDGHKVTVVDNFFMGRKRNMEHWIGHENFELINHDMLEQLYVEVDQIYHLASPASPPNYMYNPFKTLKTNTVRTLNILGLAKRVGARLFLASTSEVCRDPEVHPQTEDYWGRVNPIGPCPRCR